MDETTLKRAQAGDNDAFRELTEPHHRELLAHCYRILGSLQDAEDILQETLVAAWRALDQFDGSALRAWLYRIATNRCLNYLRDGSRRPQSVLLSELTSAKDGVVTSDEPWWLEPFPDVLLDDVDLGPEARYDGRESIALSFVAGLQRLPVRQRAILVLRDVLGFSASETADILGITPTSVNSALVRARAAIPQDRTPGQIPLPRSARESEVAGRFVDALEQGDLDQIIALLTADAKLTMPPEPIECHGPRAIAEFFQRRGVWGHGISLVPTRANSQPAFGYYLPDPNSPILRASGLVVLGLCNDQVSAITRFGDKGLLARCGLPRTLGQGGC